MKDRFYKSKLYQCLSCFSTAFKTIKRNLQGRKFEDEVYVLDKFLSHGNICFDIGAGYGRYMLPMSRLVGNSGHVYGFEPGSYSYRILSIAVKFHRLKNVTIVKKALLNETGTIKLFLPVKKTGKVGPSLAYVGTQPNSNCIDEEVETITLDEYCSVMNIPRVDFIKCDAEGAELLAFMGGEYTIERYKPTVLCEVDKGNLSKFGHTTEQLYDFFKRMRYEIFIFEGSTFNEVDHIVRNSNYIFIHRDDKNHIKQIT